MGVNLVRSVDVIYGVALPLRKRATAGSSSEFFLPTYEGNHYRTGGFPGTSVQRNQTLDTLYGLTLPHKTPSQNLVSQLLKDRSELDSSGVRLESSGAY